MHSASPYALSHPARSLLFILLTFERSVHQPLPNSTSAPPEPPGEQENPRAALGFRAQGLQPKGLGKNRGLGGGHRNNGRARNQN